MAGPPPILNGRIIPIGLPDFDQIIPPRGPRESATQYRTRFTLARYGQTPYERRIWLGQQRGLTVTQARGRHAPAGMTESEYRRRQSVEATGVPYYVTYRADLRAWLIDNGYTPQSTGMTWTQLDRSAARLRWMNANSSPGSHITPAMIAHARSLEIDGTLEPGWAYERIRSKYIAMYAYKRDRDSSLGRADWDEYLTERDSIDLPPEWWYYR